MERVTKDELVIIRERRFLLTDNAFFIFCRRLLVFIDYLKYTPTASPIQTTNLETLAGETVGVCQGRSWAPTE